MDIFVGYKNSLGKARGKKTTTHKLQNLGFLKRLRNPNRAPLGRYFNTLCEMAAPTKG